MNTDSGQPIVTVIVPLYNQERYIDACLRSICRQTFGDLEVIVVNDGSTDRSGEKARHWAARDSRVKVIEKPNQGVSMARRDGLKAATGQFVSFVDSDDTLPRRALEIMVKLMQEKDVDLLLGSVDRKLGILTKHHSDKGYTFPYNQKVEQPELFDKYYLGFYRNNLFPVTMWARLYRKDAIDRAMRESTLFDEQVNRMGEDEYFNLMLFPFLRSMYRTDEIVYNYMYNGVTTRFNPHFTQLFTLSDKRLVLLDQYHYDEGYSSLYAEYVACLYRFARQLIAYDKADRDGVIAYFKQEVANREVMKRLLQYYAETGTQRKDIRLLLDRDYEGMYEYALGVLNANRRSLKFRLRRRFLKLLGKW